MEITAEPSAAPAELCPTTAKVSINASMESVRPPKPLPVSQRLLTQSLFALVRLHQGIDAGMSRMAEVRDSILRRSRPVPKEAEVQDLGTSIGPILNEFDAPELFQILRNMSKRMGGMYPNEVRISYLPACGVLDLDDGSPIPRRVLIIGLPCLLIWSIKELQAVLAHEMAHLKQEDVIFLRDVVQYADELRQAVEKSREQRWYSPRRIWGQLVESVLRRAATPISRAMEFRADQWAADGYGARHLSRALEKLAIVQPLFREVLLRFDSLMTPKDNVYSFFCRAWRQLDDERYRRLYLQLIAARNEQWLDFHPPVRERVERLKRGHRPPRKSASGAIQLFADPKEIARVLHNRLFKAQEQQVVFYRSRGA